MTDARWIDSVDGIRAYDEGCIDSGIHDECLRKEVRAHYESLDHVARGKLILKALRRLAFGEEAAKAGYRIEDAQAILEFISDGFWA